MTGGVRGEGRAIISTLVLAPPAPGILATRAAAPPKWDSFITKVAAYPLFSPSPRGAVAFYESLSGTIDRGSVSNVHILPQSNQMTNFLWPALLLRARVRDSTLAPSHLCHCRPSVEFPRYYHKGECEILPHRLSLGGLRYYRERAWPALLPRARVRDSTLAPSHLCHCRPSVDFPRYYHKGECGILPHRLSLGGLRYYRERWIRHTSTRPLLLPFGGPRYYRERGIRHTSTRPLMPSFCSPRLYRKRSAPLSQARAGFYILAPGHFYCHSVARVTTASAGSDTLAPGHLCCPSVVRASVASACGVLHTSTRPLLLPFGGPRYYRERGIRHTSTRPLMPSFCSPRLYRKRVRDSTY
ncbi:hypothetical protein J6590_006878 [Homalodisca vitripennis]|nr:hypothetical protein J6590_006878 [Homalodisca vitripennis]